MNETPGHTEDKQQTYEIAPCLIISGKIIKALAALIPKRDPRKVLLNIHVNPQEDGQTRLEVTSGRTLAAITIPAGGTDQCYLTLPQLATIKMGEFVRIVGIRCTVAASEYLLLDNKATPENSRSFDAEIAGVAGEVSKIGIYPPIDRAIPDFGGRAIKADPPAVEAHFNPHSILAIMQAAAQIADAPEFRGDMPLLTMELRGGNHQPYAFERTVNGYHLVFMIMPYKPEDVPQ